MRKSGTFYIVKNGRDEVFSNVRNIRKLGELDIVNIRDYIFEERKRAEEALEYIRAFQNYENDDLDKHVSRSVKKKMDVIDREEWTIRELKVDYSFNLAG